MQLASNLSAPPSFESAMSQKTSAVRAGWACVALGFLTFWIFGFGMIFFSVAMVLSVVAMCKDRVKDGLILFVTSVISCGVCAILLMTFVLGGALAITQTFGRKQAKTGRAAFTSPVTLAPSHSENQQARSHLQPSTSQRISPENPNPAHRFD
jgi:hypothetical protein